MESLELLFILNTRGDIRPVRVFDRIRRMEIPVCHFFSNFFIHHALWNQEIRETVKGCHLTHRFMHYQSLSRERIHRNRAKFPL